MFGRRRTARTVRRTRRTFRRMVLLPGRRFRRRRLMVNGFTLLLVGGAAYKMGQAQAAQIQQHTGRPPEDLNQEELEQAMEELNIDTQELNAQDQAAINAELIDESAPAAAPAPAAPAPAAPVASSAAAPAANDYIVEIKRLAELRDAGIVTNEEFEAKKKQLLGL